MCRPGRTGAQRSTWVLIGGVIALVALLAAAPAEAKAARTRAATKAPPPPPGWVVDKVHVEPLDPSQPVTVHGVGDYAGSLDVIAGGAGVAAINNVSMDDYLRGIGEMPAGWPLEAQKAQAIAARSYALHEARSTVATEAHALGADICATQACQVYAGLAKSARPDVAIWNQAVAQTTNQVLLYQGEPIYAMYASSNGGQSVNGAFPYLRAVNDPDDAVSPLHHWRTATPLSAFGPAFGLPGDAINVHRDGNTLFLDWRAGDGSAGTVTLPVGDFRSRLNGAVGAPGGLPSVLPSPRFAMATDSATSQVIADGGGFGHLVGMSQYGALGKARRGMKAADILAAYYAGLRPVTVPAGRFGDRLKVEVASQGAIDVSAPGRFRITDGAGRALALVASGAWHVVPAGPGRVRVVAPDGQGGPPAIDSGALAPGIPRPGQAVDLSFRISAPAQVELTVQPPSGPAVKLPATLAEAGTVTSHLPPMAKPGRYVVFISANAGLNRVTSTPVTIEVAYPSVAAVPPLSAFPAPHQRVSALAAAIRPSGPISPLTGGLAALLLLAVAGGLGRSVRNGRLRLQ
ncbi:MAG: stage sporulation protein [Actinomycetota bacterium]|jgi:SpoIID/LytB domain protein|nr:stage sporulation protein [Actinomycetota bacterium]